MGLEIKGYKQVKKIAVTENEDGEPVLASGEVHRDYGYTVTRISIDPAFIERASEFEDGAWYEAADVDVYDGNINYSAYNDFRRELAEIGGYDGRPEAPFHDLIQFSDCEGVIGTAACKRIADAFATYAEAVHSTGRSDIFIRRYDGIRPVFELAADGGFVEFF